MANVPLGQPVPPNTPHAILGSLPAWKDVLGFAEKEKRVTDAMVAFYPRLFFQVPVRKLTNICKSQYAVGNEDCMIFPTQKLAVECRGYIKRHAAQRNLGLVEAKLLYLSVSSEDHSGTGNPTAQAAFKNDNINLYTVFFPSDTNILAVAADFWSRAGQGISGRFAEKCLSALAEGAKISLAPTTDDTIGAPGSPTHCPLRMAGSQVPGVAPSAGGCNSSSDAVSAKQALRKRIAGFLNKGNTSEGVGVVTEDDVFLFPSGMGAVWNVHKLVRGVRPGGKDICFGFPFAATLRVLREYEPGVYLEEEMDVVEGLLEKEPQIEPSKPPIHALYTEFPSNPLLKSPDIRRLRALADKHNLLLVVDDTIGGFVNVDVLPYADILMTSMTKLVSGACNVMGGSVVLNPKGRHYTVLKAHLEQIYEDTYFGEDAIVMEHNSRDYEQRVKAIDSKTEVICDFLHSRSVGGGYNEKNVAISRVFYPKYTTPEQYEVCRFKPTDGREGGGYGCLFALVFVSEAAWKAFYDALSCYKGLSFGTNFTLACLYSLLSHHHEAEWAASFGVEAGLIRITVGLEEVKDLLECFEVALKAAEDAVASEQPMYTNGHAV